MIIVTQDVKQRSHRGALLVAGRRVCKAPPAATAKALPGVHAGHAVLSAGIATQSLHASFAWSHKSSITHQWSSVCKGSCDRVLCTADVPVISVGVDAIKCVDRLTRDELQLHNYDGMSRAHNLLRLVDKGVGEVCALDLCVGQVTPARSHTEVWRQLAHLRTAQSWHSAAHLVSTTLSKLAFLHAVSSGARIDFSVPASQLEEALCT